MKKLSISLILVFIVSLLAVSCGNSATSTTTASTPATTTTSTTPAAEQPQYGGTFRYIDPRGPATTIGWLAEPGPPLGLYACTMMEGLVDVDYQGTVMPKLATGWNVASDLSSITFTLRTGVKFHDGSDFNAAVAKWNYDNYIAAHLASVKDVSSVDAVDDHTIRINLSQYSNTFLATVSSIYMISKAAFDAGGAEGLRWNPVGTGPFEFESFERDVSLKVVKFNNYWQTGKPYLDGIEAQFIIDPLTASASFEAGEADAVGGDVAKVLGDLKQKGYEVLSSYTGAITLIPDSNNADSIWANEKVREAVDYAIDRDAIVKARGFGLWTTTYQFAPPDASAYIKDLPERKYDPEKAKQLLTEAGYPDGFDTTLIGDSSTTDKEATVAVQGYLAAIGINAQLDWIDFAGFVQYVMGGWNDAILACANGFSAANINQGIDFVWSQTAAFFPSVQKTDQLQTLLDESMASKDYDPALVQKVLRYIYDTAMFLPLYCITRGHAIQSYVHDSGFYTQQNWAVFTPADTWLSK
jgi:peptide/nickel transport system substrate-binding protein